MDSWSEKQLRRMIAGGNAPCQAFFEQNGVQMSTPIKTKYHTKVAELYKQKIDALAEGKDWKPPANMAELVKQKVAESALKTSNNSSPAKSETRKSSTKTDDWDDWGEEKSYSKPKRTSSPSTQSPQEPLRSSGNTKSTNQKSGLTSSGNSYSNSPHGNSSYGNSSQSDRLSRFDGQRAISSADFFGEDQPSKKSSNNDDFFNVLGEGLSKLSTAALEGAKTASEKIKLGTSELAKSAQDKGWNTELVSNKLAETGGKGWSLAQDLWSKAKESIGEISQQLNTGSVGTYGGNSSSYNGSGFGGGPSYNSSHQRRTSDSFDTHTDVNSLDFDKQDDGLENWLNDEKPKKGKAKASTKKPKAKPEDSFDAWGDEPQQTKAPAAGWDDYGESEEPKKKKSPRTTQKAPAADGWDDWGELGSVVAPLTIVHIKEELLIALIRTQM